LEGVMSTMSLLLITFPSVVIRFNLQLENGGDI